MKIHVCRVPEEGVNEHATYHPSALDIERQDVKPIEPVEVDAFITCMDQELVVQAEIRSPVVMTCGRCLEEFPQAIAAKGIYNYRVVPTDVIDITDDVRQEIVLAYPMIPLCRQDCKGLCPQCGQNLNQGICVHRK